MNDIDHGSWPLAAMLLALVTTAGAGCLGPAERCDSDSDCFRGETCKKVDGDKQCVADDQPDDTGLADADTGTDTGTDAVTDSGTDTHSPDTGPVDTGTPPPGVEIRKPDESEKVLTATEQTFRVRVDKPIDGISFEWTADGESSPTTTRSKVDLTRTPLDGDDWEAAWETTLDVSTFDSADGHEFSVTVVDDANQKASASRAFGVDQPPHFEWASPHDEEISERLSAIRVQATDDRRIDTVEFQHCQPADADNPECLDQAETIEMSKVEGEDGVWTTDEFSQPAPDGSDPVVVAMNVDVIDSAGQVRSRPRTFQFFPFCGDGKANGDETCDKRKSPDTCCGGKNVSTPACGSGGTAECEWAPGRVRTSSQIGTDKNGVEEIADIEVSSDGKSLYVAGTFNRQLNICNSSALPEGSRDTFIAKFDTTLGGSGCQWVAVVSGSATEEVRDIEIGTSGDVYAAGNDSGTITDGDDSYLADKKDDRGWLARINVHPGSQYYDAGEVMYLRPIWHDDHSDTNRHGLWVTDLETDPASEDTFLIAGKQDNAGGSGQSYWIARYVLGGPLVVEADWETNGSGAHGVRPTDLLYQATGGNRRALLVGHYDASRGRDVAFPGATGSAKTIEGTGSPDGFVAAFGYTDGAPESAASIGRAEDHEKIRAANLDSSGNVWLATTLALDSTSSSHPWCASSGFSRGIALTQFSDLPGGNNPSPLSNHCLTDPDAPSISDLQIDDDDHLYLAGSFLGSMEVGDANHMATVTNNKSKPDGFLASYRSDLTYRWHALADGGKEESHLQLAIGGSANRLFGSANFFTELTVGDTTHTANNGSALFSIDR